MTNMIIAHYYIDYNNFYLCITSPYIHIYFINNLLFVFMKNIVVIVIAIVIAIYNKNDIFIIGAYIISSHYPNCILY